MDSTAFDLMLFGARGDLAQKKLLPSLFALHAEGRLPARWRVTGISRSPMEESAFRRQLYDEIESQQVLADYLDAHWEDFSRRLFYRAIDATDAGQMAQLNAGAGDNLPHIFYLATSAALYTTITGNLKRAGLINESARVVVEKPVGLDLASATEISSVLLEHFQEHQIYRIDHYLGKETVQNLLVLRFANTIFENQWNHRYIDHIQITIAESVGVANRGAFYDQVGALRDMVQNHLLQLLCMVAMEPPHQMTADAVRDEKVKVLRALRPLTKELIPEKVVRGQYQGEKGDDAVPGYHEEADVNGDSDTETYVAMRVEIDNWRWADVPFYLRTGKRLAARACEIAVHFKPVPHSIFSLQHKSTLANRLVFRLQPDEGIRLSLCEKRVGAGMHVRSSELGLTGDVVRPRRIPDAYERLLSDVIAGNQTLFVRDDELMAAWEWIDPVIRHWREGGHGPEPYTAGSWGPATATQMLARDGRLWDELTGAEK